MSECKECNGTGFGEYSYCCGAELNDDMMICHECKDHSDYDECGECNGKGVIDEL